MKQIIAALEKKFNAQVVNVNLFSMSESNLSDYTPKEINEIDSEMAEVIKTAKEMTLDEFLSEK